MRVHRMWVRGNEVIPGAFQNRGGGMSVDWNKYSTAEETRLKARHPADNRVVSLTVGNIRNIEGLSVEHDPIQEGSQTAEGKPLANRAHSNVLGEKTVERRLKLARIYRWELRS
jgi:hypothetical protein